MFIDHAKIYVKAGNGGKGCQSFYRDKYSRYPIPDGGDGGKGADIIIVADRNLRTLLDFRYRAHFYGEDGKHGSGKNKKGKDGKHLLIRVPCGTIIRDAKTGCILRDLGKDGEEVVVAKGGLGGRGNSGNRQVTLGSTGEEKELILDLKLIADVGVVGFPNAGKSTFISAISSAHPKIASYPFTTKVPVLGTVNSEDISFIVAEIPGLIKGSSEGRGLGDRFLRHAERTKILIQLIDMASTEGREPVEDYKIINEELKKYSLDVFRKPRLIVANKMDLETAEENLKRFQKKIRKRVYPISALNKIGIKELISAIVRELKK